MTRQDRIITALNAALSPRHLEVRDVSAQHHGHGGWREGGETHFEVDIASPEFDAMTRIAAHRMVNDALADELASGLHALQIKIIT
ncbi:MAG: BolA family transcriptional regulator [Alphaproteobacteria bacterium]|nr:BolA family transcriptional regulator [Alphaproteobacteria bacterium]